MAFSLPDLPYAYDALAPHMSAETLEYHHDKHHNAYLETMNGIIEGTEYESMELEEIVKKSHKDNPKLFNQSAQFYNHVHFWKWMKPDGGGKTLPEKLSKAFESDLGGYDKFREDFINAGKTQFGSGWAWVFVKDGKLQIDNGLNGENPLIMGGTPILGVDVWEHSYYIDYRNARPKYLEAFVDNLINWDYVLERYEVATS
ncbi:superoxide dismutase [Notoacmeibacter sp. MSK16QG-6]|uniref:superoxide dismutase n=1 Tax=Notoacmeibacter sp. MSK16QG-6 TaxID=2957982 RepID=UPI00209F106E|nr:superoxide dismutase [Notoacmeibacter sp. MSK16QG-6]MCP1198167.1 superoxide dismutase [Notoacmeibacter sp. MSK16QG-6]